MPRKHGANSQRPIERRKPDISVVVVVYNIPREAPRTLLSLSADYQRHIGADDYEVIVVDNGSNPPFDPKLFETLAGNFRLIRIDPAPPSPAHAINRGLAEAQGDIIGVMIDGARIVTPGLLHFARHGARLYDRTVVATLGLYLGYDYQSWAMRAGYDQSREDALLAQIGWPQDGYRLFEIGTLDESSVDCWLLPISESNGLFLRREMWTAMGGADERFDSPGGGLLNLDTFRRAMELPDTELVVLLGEGSFHQIHGGVATNAPVEEFPDSLRRWAAQYQAIRGRPFDRPNLKKPTTYLGILPQAALARFVRAALEPSWGEPPLGPHFDRALWAIAPSKPPSDPTLAAIIGLAQDEFRSGRYEAAAAVARLIRERAPDEPGPQRLLSLAGAWLSAGGPPVDRRARYHLALGEFYRLTGDNAQAGCEYQTALTFDPTLQQAVAGSAAVRLQMKNPRRTQD
jgi:tetratricopeptide (TPR) repeat protein